MLRSGNFVGPNGLWSPFGIETGNAKTKLQRYGYGQMACGARSGLKPQSLTLNIWFLIWLNGLWSPFGIETVRLIVSVTMPSPG